MPDPGTVNNPSGVNSFDQFAAEPQYGEGIQQKALAGGAPLAGAPVASGAIQAPKRAQRSAGKPSSAPAKPQPQQAQPSPLPQPPDGPPTPAQVWQQLAAEPGASPLILDYAARAAKSVEAPAG